MNPELIQALVVPVGFLIIFYLFIIRPQKKKENEITEMRSNLAVGDKIITIGGIHGKIIVLKEEVLTIEVGSAKTKLEISKWAVGSVEK